jgi:hypothetical protein
MFSSNSSSFPSQRYADSLCNGKAVLLRRPRIRIFIHSIIKIRIIKRQFCFLLSVNVDQSRKTEEHKFNQLHAEELFLGNCQGCSLQIEVQM